MRLRCNPICFSLLLFAVGGLVLVGYCGEAEAQNIRRDFYVTDGPVDAELLSGNTLYLGGSFTRVAPATGGGIPLDPISGLSVKGFPKVLGIVYAVVADGAGGWYIGGDFTSVGEVQRSNLAHILSDTTVSAWDPGVDPGGFVFALAVNGGTVYAGGLFFSIGGQMRNHIAALDANTGLATAWDPNAGPVYALAVSGSTVYAGGEFTSMVGGQPRNYIAAIDASTGLATTWAPNASFPVRALAVSGDTVYAGGQLSTMNEKWTTSMIEK